MAKRIKSKYNTRSYYSLFCWQECTFCGMEFRNERGYRLWPNGIVCLGEPVHSCGSCSKSKEDFEKKWEDKLEWRRKNRPAPPKAPPTPPRAR